MVTILSTSNTAPAPAGQTRRHLLNICLGFVVVTLLIWSWRGSEINLTRLVQSFPQIANFLDRMFPPDLTWRTDQPRPLQPPLRLAQGAVAVTLQIALLGTALGAAVALVLGFLGAQNLTPRWVHHPIKVALAMLRSIPVLLLALLFLFAVGFGAFPGVLAIAIHSTGMLGKLFSEECETADRGVWEAMDSAGANWFQKVRYAVWPQMAPQISSLALFRLEMNVRDSAVLGFIAVPGLGWEIEQSRRVLDYASVCTWVIVTMLVVLAVDQLSFHVRRHLK